MAPDMAANGSRGDGQLEETAALLTASAQTVTANVRNCRLALSACQRSNRWRIAARATSSSATFRSAGCHGASDQLIDPALSVERVCATASPPPRSTGSERLVVRP